jgi:hypothetical protein
MDTKTNLKAANLGLEAATNQLRESLDRLEIGIRRSSIPAPRNSGVHPIAPTADGAPNPRVRSAS